MEGSSGSPPRSNDYLAPNTGGGSPARPANRAVRSPSVTLQRLPSSQSVNTAAANAARATSPSAAAANRRSRAATVANPLSPTQERDEQSNSAAQQQHAHFAPTPTVEEGQGDLETGGSAPTKKPSLLSFSGLFGGGGGAAARKRAATTSAGVSASGGRRRGASTSSGHSIELSHNAQSGSRRRSQGSDNATLLDQSSAPQQGQQQQRTNYDSRVQDLLDVLDPEVQTLNNLGDIQNSLFIPYTGFFDRTRKIQLTKPPPRKDSLPEDAQAERERISQEEAAADAQREGRQDETEEEREERLKRDEKELPGVPPPRKDEESTVPDGVTPATETQEAKVAEEKVVLGKYFVLPSSLVDMSDWTEEEKAELDDYVRHLMHNKKEIFKRKMRGFGKYVRTPLGAFVTIYASLLTFWGAAWVLFLIGWLNVGEQQDYYIEICDQILVALFCLVGLGLIPWRAVDSYHMWYIVKYHYRTLRLRKQRGLPPLEDKNDLPNDRPFNQDLERAGHGEDAVLTDEEQQIFAKHQAALAKSHTYYRPHATQTHRAFPMGTLLGIIILCDMHSTFQLALGSATWSISYHRDFKHILTTIILCFSLSSNITAGILISVGNRKTRKVAVVEALMRKAITQEALKRREDAEAYRAEKRAELQKDREHALKQRQSEDRHRAQQEGHQRLPGSENASSQELFRESADLPRTSSGRAFLTNAGEKIRMSFDKEGRASKEIVRSNSQK